jgi:hypothetical protein
MQAGFSSRLAAILAVRDGHGKFRNASELLSWIQSAPVQLLTKNIAWPTVETHALWVDFVSSFGAQSEKVWRHQGGQAKVTWANGKVPEAGTPLRLGVLPGTEDEVYSASYELLGKLQTDLNKSPDGLFLASASAAYDEIAFEYLGPDDL